jgi:hypothetical protein
MRSVAARPLPPEASAFTVHVLPICPRPYQQEAAHSWLARVGRVYALDPARLVGILGLVPFKPGSRRYISRPVEAALDSLHLDQLALASQLPPARLAEMRPDPVEWTLTHTDVCAVCGLCLDEDLCRSQDPYLRADWRRSWRIFCSIHKVRLLRCPMNVVKGAASDAPVIEQIDDLYAHCRSVQDNIDAALGSNRDFFHLTLAIEEMEEVIHRAISGEAPNAFVWGSLSAAEFLRIVRDVTSWALTNFEAFRARPAAEELPLCICATGMPYFGKSYRLQRPFDSNSPVRTLSSVNDPALRCPALWWAHVLLCESHRCCNRTEIGLLARQWHLLQSQCQAGLLWLRERMAEWPSEYIRQRWTPIGPMLWPEVDETAKGKVSS